MKDLYIIFSDKPLNLSTFSSDKFRASPERSLGESLN